MTAKSCAICQQTPTTKCSCGLRLCVDHESVLTHDCAYSKKLDEIASDPKKLREWKKANGHEQDLTTAVVLEVRKLPEIVRAWQGKKAGIRAHDLEPGLPDVLAYSRGDSRLVGIETKRNHKAGCPCDSCKAQREWGAELVANNGVYIADVRTVQAAIDGVRLGLAMARGRSAA